MSGKNRVHIISIFLFSVFALGAAPKDLAAQEKHSNYGMAGETFYWSSANKNLGQLSSAIDTLLIAMYNAGVLPIEEVKITKVGDGASAVFANRGVPVVYWTDQMDSLACDLNSGVCGRPRELIEMPLEEIGFAEHVGGWKITKPSQSNWKVNIGDTIKVPALETRSRIRYRPIPIIPGLTIRDLHDRYAGGCPVLSFVLSADYRERLFQLAKEIGRDAIETYQKEPCAFYVMALNAELWQANEQDYGVWFEDAGKLVIEEGKKAQQIVLPVLMADIPVTMNVGEMTETWNAKGITVSSQWFKFINERDSEYIKSRLYDALDGHIRGIEKGAAQSDQAAVTAVLSEISHDDLYGSFQHQVFEFLDHPYAVDKALPALTPQRIGLIDKGYDPNHCEYWENEECSDEFLNERPPLAYHGNHVASIIAARKGNGGMIGINPSAKIIHKEVDLDGDKVVVDENATDALNRLWFNQRADMVVIAGGFSAQGVSLLELAIEDMADNEYNNLIVVVAAGNVTKDTEDPEGRCSYIPACLALSYDNVISVGGLKLGDHGHELWTNGVYHTRSHPGITTLTVAEPVLVATPAHCESSVHSNCKMKGGSYRLAAGTSFATPLVAGMISLMRGGLGDVSAREVKARLVGCGDYLHRYKDSALSHLPSTECMMDHKYDRIAIDRQDGRGQVRVQNGRITAFWGPSETRGDLRPIDRRALAMWPWASGANDPTIIEYSNLIKLEWDDDIDGESGFVVYYWGDSGIERMVGADMHSINLLVEVNFENGEMQCIPIDEIREIVPTVRGNQFRQLSSTRSNSCWHQAKRRFSQ